MPQGDEREEHGRGEQGDAPGARDGAQALLQHARQYHDHALPEDRRDAVEGAADAHEGGLLLLLQGDHIVAVRGDVVRGGGEGDDVEDDQRPAEDVRADAQREAGEADGAQQLHQHDPPALGADHVHEGAPQGLDDPGEVEQGGVHGQVAVRHAQALEHRHGDVVDDEVGNALGEVERGDPPPGGA